MVGEVVTSVDEIWLPQSGYLPARIVDDFEWHDERSTRKKGAEIDLYVAIKDGEEENRKPVEQT